jgi:putative membrane protein
VKASTVLDSIPSIIAGLNACTFLLLISALVAIRRQRRELHRNLMILTLGVSFVFVVFYVIQVATTGHRRFPGDDWVRSVFLAILVSHTLLAVTLLPLVFRTVYLAARQRFDQHRRIARVTFPIWIYISVTGVLIYWMNSHLRPAG